MALQRRSTNEQTPAARPVWDWHTKRGGTGVDSRGQWGGIFVSSPMHATQGMQHETELILAGLFVGTALDILDCHPKKATRLHMQQKRGHHVTMSSSKNSMPETPNSQLLPKEPPPFYQRRRSNSTLLNEQSSSAKAALLNQPTRVSAFLSSRFHSCSPFRRPAY